MIFFHADENKNTAGLHCMSIPNKANSSETFSIIDVIRFNYGLFTEYEPQSIVQGGGWSFSDWNHYYLLSRRKSWNRIVSSTIVCANGMGHIFIYSLAKHPHLLNA